MAKKKVWVEVDTKNKKLKSVLYHFKPDNVPVVEIELKKDTKIEYGAPVEKRGDKWVIKEKK